MHGLRTFFCKLKICGIKDKDILSAAIKAGADFVGLVFFPKSPRHVSIPQAKELAEFARQNSGEFPTKVVALVVNATNEELETIHKRG